MKRIIAVILLAFVLVGCQGKLEVTIRDKQHPNTNTYVLYTSDDRGNPTNRIFYVDKAQYDTVEKGDHVLIAYNINNDGHTVDFIVNNSRGR